MLIEYKIKFEKDGLTIAQHIEPNSTRTASSRTKVPVTGLPATQHEVTTLAAQNPLAQGGASGDQFGGASGDPFGGASGDQFGGGAPGSAPIFILGPIVFSNAAPEHVEPTEPPKPQPQKPHSQARSAAAGKQE
jgi:hypothetical protein